MPRHFNFSAGPATLPIAVLERAKQELLDWQGGGTSVMEVSHRSKDYVALAVRAERQLRELLSIPEDYAVLFLSGGATLQFAGVPLNLLRGRADYVETGAWSAKAYAEAKRYANAGLGTVHLAATTDGNYTTIPKEDTWQVHADADYLHYCSNETVHGVQFFNPPQVAVPLVADMSSDILARAIDVRDYGLIYAGAQKNIGPAGLTIVIVRRELLDGQASPFCPSVLNYTLQANSDSMLNTPPTYAWYLAGLVFEWLLEQGGVAAIETQNRAKAALLYQTIDNSSFYHNGVDSSCRSLMNVPFTLADSGLDELFLTQATQAGLLALKGHRLTGGMRASLYNAMPLAGVVALTKFMQDFERRYG